MMNAIGMIETKGLLAAIEGADVMLKAADVTLLDKSSATGGLITITVTGEVSAVQAAIESATASITRLNPSLLISKHVIARPSTSLENIISTSAIHAESSKQVETEELAAEESPAVVEETQAASEETPTVIEDTNAIAEKAPVISEEVPVIAKKKPATVASPIEMTSPAAEVASVIEDETTSKSVEDKSPEYSASELQKMNLKNLREIANKLPELNTKVDIKKATKKTLIKFIRESQTNEGRK
ncbi:MAG: BMC domain-containing protein [Moritella sp.]|uniref:BMC domain-containing protein n=1 Tax=Moritella sp. TaxID=78556 RepID=UPI0029BB5C40|nr:BMC domain-containing protein [Moritella sp.]MDX2322260.1 BMC domain-containing protein [Moritella sp.]